MNEQAGAQQPNDHPSTAKPTFFFTREVYDMVEWLTGVAVLAVLLLSFVASTVITYGESMEQTLLPGDRLLVTRLGTFKAGDIVAIVQPNNLNKPLVKRIIAKEGQTIDIDFKSAQVTIDGVLQDEPYINTPTNLFFDLQFPLTVPPGCVFVMGDNRNHSLDSRSGEIGMIDERYILGKTLVRFAPLDRIGKP